MAPRISLDDVDFAQSAETSYAASVPAASHVIDLELAAGVAQTFSVTAGHGLSSRTTSGGRPDVARRPMELLGAPRCRTRQTARPENVSAPANSPVAAADLESGMLDLEMVGQAVLAVTRAPHCFSVPGVGITGCGHGQRRVRTVTRGRAP